MSFAKMLSTGAVTALLLCPVAASADVTPEQVWQFIVGSYGQSGQTITAAKTERQGDTLVVTDAQFNHVTPELTYSQSIAEIRLRDMGDGQVEVTMSEDIPIKMVAKTPGAGETGTGTGSGTGTAAATEKETDINVRAKGAKAIVGGTPEKLDFALNAPDTTVTLEEGTKSNDKPPVRMEMTLHGLVGNYHVDTTSGRAVAYDLVGAKMEGSFIAAGNDGDKSVFNVAFNVADLVGKGEAVIPADANTAMFNEALAKGFLAGGDFSYGAAGATFDGSGGETDFRGQSSAKGGGFVFALSRDGISYDNRTTGTQLSLTSPSLPAPVEISADESAAKFALPVMKSETGGRAAIVMKLTELKMSDAIWALFDPQAKLPRDPATVIVDLSGTVRPLIDLFDTEQATAFAASAEAGQRTPPLELSEAQINDLDIQAAGARLRGNGEITLDNSATPPKPSGTIDLSLVGGNKLLDNLVAAGLLPQDQSMGLRMMLGMFAVPNGDDSMTSKLEMKPDGSLFANGQRLQ